MTACEASELLAETIIELSHVRRDVVTWAERALNAEQERDSYRMVAYAAIHHAHDLGRQVTDLEQRYHRALDGARELRGQLFAQTDRSAAA